MGNHLEGITEEELYEIFQEGYQKGYRLGLSENKLQDIKVEAEYHIKEEISQEKTQ